MPSRKNNQTPLPPDPIRPHLRPSAPRTKTAPNNQTIKDVARPPDSKAENPISSFHPAIQAWFSHRFKAPTDAQAAGWPRIRERKDVLIAAPTGSGKTLSAFLVAIDELLKREPIQIPDSKVQSPTSTTVVYVSPLKALGNDIQRNLDAPLQEIRDVAAELGIPIPEITTAVRTGDTPQSDRQAIVRRPPDILITTPESLYLMLTAARSRANLTGVRTVIVDEIHALARDKRGSHLSLSLARLDHVVAAAGNPRPARIGLSATQRPIDEIAAFLGGVEPSPPNPLSRQGERGDLASKRESSGASEAFPEAPLSPRGGGGLPALPISVTTGQQRSDEIAAFLGGVEPSPPNPLSRQGERGDLASKREGSGANEASPEAPLSPRARGAGGGGLPGLPTIVDLGHQRDIALHIEVPPSDLEAVAPKEQWGDIYDRLAELVKAHRTTLIFVNTRRLSERVAHNLAQRFGAGPEGVESADAVVASHHGSLSRDRRLKVEERLKNGQLRALVATASLELGIDIGSIDLVCQIGSPRSIATFLQRVGRSGHALGLRPHGRLFATTRDELVECAALVRAVKAGRLDRIVQPVAPLDILAQQIVAEVACEDWAEDGLFDLFRTAYPYRDLKREDFDEIVEMLADGVGEGAGRSPALVHHDRINHMLRGRRNSRLTAILNGGAIPELGDYRVIADPDETVVGTVNEDWAIESMAGDIFLLGSTSWKIRRIESNTGVVRVEDAHGAPPSIPFWLGEAPGRTLELSEEVGRLRRDVVDAIGDSPRLKSILAGECGLDDLGSAQIVDYLRATRDALGLVPSDTEIVFERFFDESGGMQLVVHAPFGARINRAYGLTLRKRFCVNFDFELQAAASDDAIVLSLGPQHSFPLEEAFDFVSYRNAREALTQSILYVPTFPTRWRWDATRALAVPRQRAGRKVPPQLQRMRADDLLAAVFPAQVGCQENLTGPLEIPDHPLIRQAVDDCLHEAMDLDGLLGVLHRIDRGQIKLYARDTVEPSPMAHEILAGKPYTYLDDAPLEERRTRAVTLRRTLPESSRDLGVLDQDAIDRVCDEAWPSPRNPEEVHEALLSLVALRPQDAPEWADAVAELITSGRAAILRASSAEVAEAPRPEGRGLKDTDGFSAEGARLDLEASASGPGYSTFAGEAPAFRPGYPEASATEAPALRPGTPPLLRNPPSPAMARPLWFAAENLELVSLLYPAAAVVPPLSLAPGVALPAADREDARMKLLRGQTEALGPITAAALAERVGLTETDVDYGLRFLEANGYVLRGRFSAGIDADEFCDRRLLARVHRYTLDRLRREIDAVTAQDFMRFLLRWHHLTPDTRLEGKIGVRQAINRLQGFEAAASAWERELLAARVKDYRVSWLDELCLGGDVAWARLTPRKATASGAGPVPSKQTPVTVALRPDFEMLLASVRGQAAAPEPSKGAAGEVLELLKGRGALFFDEIVTQTRRLRTDIERGLRELVAWGLVTADGFQGLRQLTGGIGQTSNRKVRAAYGGGLFSGAGPSGRWAIVRAPVADSLDIETLAEGAARVLLQRYGVVFRDLIVRESLTVPWREVLRALRRFEARGLVRGGRFVAGFVGEQYALPEAVDALRRVRRIEREGERVWVSAVDPLNLAGIIVPGPKLPAQPGKGALYIDGLPQEAAPSLPARAGTGRAVAATKG